METVTSCKSLPAQTDFITAPSGAISEQAKGQPSTVLDSGYIPPMLKGVVNKGNTCYASSIIQCLFAMPSFCSHMFSLSQPKSSLGRSFLKICQAMKQARAPVDPSPFLSALEGVSIKSGKIAFDLFSQHDVAEILELILAEFFIDSPFVSGLFNFSVIFSRQCEKCGECS